MYHERFHVLYIQVVCTMFFCLYEFGWFTFTAWPWPDFNISILLVFSRSGEWRLGHLDNGNKVDGDKAMKIVGRKPRLDISVGYYFQRSDKIFLLGFIYIIAHICLFSFCYCRSLQGSLHTNWLLCLLICVQSNILMHMMFIWYQWPFWVSRGRMLSKTTKIPAGT
jgi:hypothetical protein